jgi:hypothetical protein
MRTLIEDEQKAERNKLQKLRNERRGCGSHLLYLGNVLARSVCVSKQYNNSFTRVALLVLKSLKSAASQNLAASSLKLPLSNLQESHV